MGRDPESGRIWRLGKFKQLRAATVAVAVAVGVPVEGDTPLVPKSEKEASAV